MADPKIKRVLMSVTDKTGVVDFARALHDEFGAEIISTGGTAKVIAEAGVPVIPIDEVTHFPEMMDGRVKTLHPMVHGGLLAKRDNPQHMAEAAEHGIQMIDMVVVNLYAFEKTVDPAPISAPASRTSTSAARRCCAALRRTSRAWPWSPILKAMMTSWPRCARTMAPRSARPALAWP